MEESSMQVVISDFLTGGGRGCHSSQLWSRQMWGGQNDLITEMSHG
jgi:hypothetical protein